MTLKFPVDGDFWLETDPDVEGESREKNEKLDRFFNEINIILGGSSVQVELTEEDYAVAFNRALAEFRAISQRSIWEGFGFLKTKPNVQTYILHKAIDNVVQLWRKRALFAGANTGFDYFSQVAAGLIYPGSQPGGYQGIATYDFALQYEETLNRMFARDYQFRFRPENNTLFLLQVPRAEEEVVIECSVMKTVSELLTDHWAENWLLGYTTAYLKTILGAKRSKFGSAPGAQGGTQLDGATLKQEGVQEMKDLRQKIIDFEDGGVPGYPILG